jgi:putative NADH-flavin reductase
VNVIVFGATGAVGRRIVDHALEAGHNVTAFVREPDRLQTQHDRLRVASGDVLDADAVGRAVTGQNGALVAIGARRDEDPESVTSQGTAHIVAAMAAAGARRLVLLSIMGVGESMRQTGLARFVLPRVMGAIIRDRTIAEEAVRASDLEWVIVRPTRLSDKPGRGRYRAGTDLRAGLLSSASRDDVASFMVEQLESDEYLRRAPSMTS